MAAPVAESNVATFGYVEKLRGSKFHTQPPHERPIRAELLRHVATVYGEHIVQKDPSVGREKAAS